jgi:MoaA/NifB/PqqE/SkfB family radical SAM enzyme
MSPLSHNQTLPQGGSTKKLRDVLLDLKWAWRWPGIPSHYVTFRKILNFYRSQLAWLTGRQKVNAYPWQLTVELTNACNLRCPQCPTGQGRLGRKASMVSLDQLRLALEELGPYAFTIDLHNWGEPFLHKQIFEAIRMCEDHRVMTVICSNFNIPFDAAKAEDLVRSGLSVLSVSLDGSEQQSYEIYRVRGDLGVPLRNVALVQMAKQRLGKANPRIIWSYLVFRHNEHDIENARSLARKYGMEFCATRGLSNDPTWQTTGLHLNVVDDMARRGPSCRWLYSMAVINADLGVSPCCVQDAFSSATDFGSIRENSFKQVWNSPRYRAARDLFSHLKQGRFKPQVPVCCETCRVFTSRKEGIE